MTRLAAALALALALLASSMSASAGPEDFATKRTAHFRFVHRARYAGSIRNTVAVAEPARAKLVREFGIARAPATTEVRVARDVAEMRQLSPRRPPSYADAVAFPSEGLIVLSLTSSHHRSVSLETVFRHELVHMALRWAVGEVPVPRWFNEGLAVLYSEELPLDRMRTMWPAAAAGRLIPLHRLDRSFPRREFQVNLAYAQSADLVRYLVVHDGRWRLLELFGRLRAGQPFDAALAASWNASLQDLDAEWQADVRRRFSIVPSITAGVSLWALIGVLAVVAYFKRRREIRRRIEAMPDRPLAAEVESGEAG